MLIESAQTVRRSNLWIPACVKLLPTNQRAVGRVTPCAPPLDLRRSAGFRRRRRKDDPRFRLPARNWTIIPRPRGGAHGVSRPTRISLRSRAVGAASLGKSIEHPSASAHRTRAMALMEVNGMKKSFVAVEQRSRQLLKSRHSIWKPAKGRARLLGFKDSTPSPSLRGSRRRTRCRWSRSCRCAS